MMADVHKLSEQMIDLAERLSDVADAAAGKRRTPRSSASSGAAIGRWILLPAAGAALYAAGRSRFFARQAKSVLGEARLLTEEAKSRAADLPNELLNNVRQKSAGNGRSTSQTRRRNSSARATPRSRAAGRRSSSRRASTSG
jgi:hypothetical protein